MASGTPTAHKRSSFHRFSHTILQLASPPFSRVSFDAQGFGSRKKLSPVKTHGGSVSVTSSLDKPDTYEAYTPSIISAVESQLSSPYTPLLPSPKSLNRDDSAAAVPPTTNDLSDAEKMKLMRKVRKLSRVLGEIPVPTAVEEELMPTMDHDGDYAHTTVSPLDSDGTSKMRSTSASAKKAFRRSLTFGQGSGSTLLEVHDVRHARSLSALRPSLNLPRHSTTSDIPVTPSSPITFARPESVLSNRDISECYLSTSAPEPHGSDLQSLKRRDSTASSVLLADQNVERMQRNRAAKLSRHFGTNVPPEAFLGASSLPTPPASAPALPPTEVFGSELLPARSSSLRHKAPAPRRPASLDVRPTSVVLSEPNSPTRGSAQHRAGEPSSLKRSKSLWTRRPQTSDGTENAAVGDFDLDSIAPGLTEKQRMLNVRRAKKMAQLFGDNPPTALFQITNIPAGAEPATAMARSSSDGHRYDRDSLATIISVSTTSLSPTLSATHKARLRDSFISVLTTSSDVSGLALTGETPEDEERQSNTEQDIVVQTTMSSVPVISPIPIAGRQGIRSASGPALNRFEHSTTPHTRSALPMPLPPFAQLPGTPQTPPPFSNFILAHEPRPATAPPASPAPSEFQTRRRRAAKLSKFFGVEVNELADALPTDVAPSRKASLVPKEGSAFDDVDSVHHRHHRRASLVVAEATRRQYPGMDGRDEVEERDMSEIIDRLRRMKSC